jgi:hypothetical protein
MNHPCIESVFDCVTKQWKVYMAPAPWGELDDNDQIMVIGSGRTCAEAVEATVRELESAVQALKASVLN